MTDQDRMPTPVVAIIHLDHGRLLIQRLTDSQLYSYEVWQETPKGMVSVARAKTLTSALERTKLYIEALESSQTNA